MKPAAQEDAARAFLERLLVLSEKRPDRTRPASAAPDYNGLATAEALKRFGERLRAAARVGAIVLREGKRERRHLIERATVKDTALLALHLGYKPAPLRAEEARAELLPIIAGGAPWLGGVLDDIITRWARAEPALRLAPSSLDLAREFLSLLAATSLDQARGLDARTFSLKTTGDTKAFDRHATRLATVLASHFGDLGMTSDEIWNRIGLDRFAHPVHVKGCLVAVDASGVLVDGRAKPFASFHPELRPLLQLRTQPSALLTIENYASFNRYVREIEDGALIVYTGGFASIGVIELLKAILERMEPRVPFFHWGDIDPGGLRIFRFLEESLPRRPLPHQMDQTLAQALGKPAPVDPTLKQIAKTNSAVAALASWLCEGNTVRHLEQEALDPTSPVSGEQPARSYV
jgi:Uncharacterized protein conserved in bacteria C-term(DUF2220)/Uncharacterized protein conserved in bacteria N-term (DUF3322)